MYIGASNSWGGSVNFGVDYDDYVLDASDGYDANVEVY